MKENALVLNEADKTLMYLVGCDEGEVTNFANMMSIKTLPGSTYLDKLNKGFYQKVAVEGKASDWVRLAGSKPTKCAVFAMAENTSYLGKRAVDQMVKENLSFFQDSSVDREEHDTLFYLKSLDLDMRMHYKLGTIYACGREHRACA